MGAWIETLQSATPNNVSSSHPVWVRGLKLEQQELQLLQLEVAPRVGAWIETLCISSFIRSSP